ncbi:MAG: ribonucleotide reductase subunit alpha [Burkholderiales bacterium]|jgi:hypothetical protein
MMMLSSFDDLLRAARAQPERQRLLLVFASIGLSDEAPPERRAAFEAGQGGELTPVMCVDKSPDEVEAFASLAATADSTGQDWGVVFVTAMSGQGGADPDAAEVETALRRMIDAIGNGHPGPWVPFDRNGRPLRLA